MGWACGLGALSMQEEPHYTWPGNKLQTNYGAQV